MLPKPMPRQQPQAKQQQQQQPKQQPKQQQQQQPKQQQQQPKQPKQQQLAMQVQQPQASGAVVVRMTANPLVDRLTAYDLQYLKSSGGINDEIVNFHLGTCQLEALHICHNAEQSWVFLNTFYFDKLSRSFYKGEYDMLFRRWFRKQRLRMARLHMASSALKSNLYFYHMLHIGLTCSLTSST